MIIDFLSKIFFALIFLLVGCSSQPKLNTITNSIQKIENTECVLESKFDVVKKVFNEIVTCKSGYAFNFPDVGYDTKICYQPINKIEGIKNPMICELDKDTIVYVN